MSPENDESTEVAAGCAAIIAALLAAAPSPSFLLQTPPPSRSASRIHGGVGCAVISAFPAAARPVFVIPASAAGASEETYPNPLQDNPAYSVVKKYFVNADGTICPKIVVHKDAYYCPMRLLCSGNGIADIIEFLGRIPTQVSSKQEVVDAFVKEQFFVDVAQWVATNLRRSSPLGQRSSSNFSGTFGLNDTSRFHAK